jgi:hypothetical protein
MSAGVVYSRYPSLLHTGLDGSDGKPLSLRFGANDVPDVDAVMESAKKAGWGTMVSLTDTSPDSAMASIAKVSTERDAVIAERDALKAELEAIKATMANGQSATPAGAADVSKAPQTTALPQPVPSRTKRAE